jgi:hypothetical protein
MSVYFATADGYTKIGYSADPAGRMTTVTRNGQRPDDLPFGAKAHLIGWIPGDRAVEAGLHRRFAAHHAAGEWFSGIKDGELRSIVEDDPRGIDVDRMTALAVFVAIAHPELTRDEIAALGVRIDAVPEPEALRSWSDDLTATERAS